MQLALKSNTFSEIMQNNGHYTVQGIQGHWLWYQSKAHIWLPISE